MGILSGILSQGISHRMPHLAVNTDSLSVAVPVENVNERSAIQMAAVYSCVRILSEAVASLPLHVCEYNGDGGKEKAVKHPLYFLLHDEPNPEMTSFVFRETLMPNRMTVDRNDKGQLYYQYNTSKDDALPLVEVPMQIRLQFWKRG